MGGTPYATWREAAVGDDVLGGGGGLDHGEHDAGGAEVEGFLGPGGGWFREAEDGWGGGGGEGSEDGECGGDVSGAVLHVDDDIIVAREAGDLGEGWGVGEEEEAVEGIAGGEAGF